MQLVPSASGTTDYTLAPLPKPLLRSLTEAELAELRKSTRLTFDLPKDKCLTCRKQGPFKTRLHDRSVVTCECNCREQWMLGRLLLAAGIGDTYQRYSWHHVRTVPDTIVEMIKHYLGKLDDFFDAGVGMILWSERTGCIYGDAEIIVNRGGNGVRRTLKDVVEKFNGGGGRYPWDLSIPTYVQREVDGVVRLGRLINAWASGVKQTYTVTTETGRSIRATDEHPFLTERGWLRLDELMIGDLVHVRGEQKAAGRRKLQYHQTGRMQNHPHALHRNDGTALVPTHRVVAEAERNGLSFDAYVERVASGDIEGLVFLDSEVWAVHHVDHDHRNNDLANLLVLTHEEHRIYHAESGSKSNVLYKIALEKIISVEPYGLEETYDLEVADDPHNFLADGFVVHNTGKSLLAYLILKEALAQGYTARMTTLTEMLDHYTASWSDKAHRDWFLREIQNVDFLAIDEFGKENPNRGTVVDELVDRVIRARVAHGRPTILPTNLNPSLGMNVGKDFSRYQAGLLDLLTERSLMIEVVGLGYREQQQRDLMTDVREGIRYPVVVR